MSTHAADHVIPRNSDLFGKTGHDSQDVWDAASSQITPGRGHDAQPIADRGAADPSRSGEFKIPYENPLVGAGWAVGSDGAPELHTGVASSEMREGAEMWSIRQDESQHLVAVLKDTGFDVTGRTILEWVETK